MFMRNLILHLSFLMPLLGLFITAAPVAMAGSKPLTIAAVIMPQQADGSSWDIGEGADLVLCGVKGCYVSNGLEKAATFYEGGVGPRILEKAGACRDVVKCVFRGVELAVLTSLDAPAIYLMDVDYVSHTKLEELRDLPSAACAVKGVTIACEQGVHKQAFSLWVMDEAVAEAGGRVGLDHVLFRGILNQRSKALTAEIGALRLAVKRDAALFYKRLFDIAVPEACLEKPEFLSEIFYVTGLADAKQRRAEALLQDLLGRVELARLEGLVQNTPAVFWAFRDIARQLGLFAAAPRAQLEAERQGLYLTKLNDEATETLIYGWDVQTRARAGLADCGVEVSLEKSGEGVKSPPAAE